MNAFETSQLRNLALIGHGHTGKTSLVSALLFAAGMVKRLGKVDDGTSVTDFDAEEIERKISLQAALAHAVWKGHKINLIDTPGSAAFIADAIAGLAVADAALLLVDAVDGIQTMTGRMFRYAKERSLPVTFVINKTDRERASFDRTLAALQEQFGRPAVALQLPLGAEQAFAGVVDLLTMKAHRYATDGSCKMKEEPIPADLVEAATEARAALVEMIAESDETLLEVFFDKGDLPDEQLREGLAAAVRSCKIFPVVCTAATNGIGAASLLDVAVEVLPSPDRRGEHAGRNPNDDGELVRKVADSDPLSVFVFKTIADPFAGRLSLFRVCSGLFRADTPVVNVRTGNSERLGHLSVAQGKQFDQVGELHAGDIGLVAKLKETATSDTLADPAARIAYPPIEFPEPAISFAIEAKTKGDEDKLSVGLARLTEEDPMLRVGRAPQTHELLVSGSSQVHVEVAIVKLKNKFGVEAALKQPKVAYLETITKKVGPIEGKHKKQSGGRGQFGVCVIEMEPLPRGSKYEFVDKIFGGAIPNNYRPAVDKGIQEAADRGVLAGYPVVDFRVTLLDGKYHNVDSSEMAFKIAGSLAFKEGVKLARPTLLEPIMSVEITAPEDCMGDLMGDLSSRRGKPQGMEIQGDLQLIRAEVPMAEMLSYASTLKSITSDRGAYVMQFDHYAPVPGHVQEQIIAEAAKARQEE